MQLSGSHVIELHRPSDAALANAPHWRAGQRCYIFCRFAAEWCAALVLAVPAGLAILLGALGVKLTSAGPAFYSQVRLGRHGRTFRMHKLRTMPHQCEADTGPVWSSPTDPRATRFGRFLRDTHLDELPQIWNVLAGQMSLIGPRPERPEIAQRIERVLPRYRHRLLLRPGMTGFAQVQLPADTNLADVRHKLAYDLHYLHEIGLWLDLRICIGTVFYFLGVIFSALCCELVKSERRHAEERIESIEFLDDVELEINTR